MGPRPINNNDTRIELDESEILINTSNIAPQPPETSTTAISVAFGNLTLNCSMRTCSVGAAEEARKRAVLQIDERKFDNILYV